MFVLPHAVPVSETETELSSELDAGVEAVATAFCAMTELLAKTTQATAIECRKNRVIQYLLISAIQN